MTDSLDTPALVVTRWTRYGKDRAYVALGERQLGHRDLHTGEVHSTDGRHASAIAHATDGLWRKAQAARYAPRHAIVDQPVIPPAPPSARPAPASVPPPAAPLLPDRDLAANRPGEAVRARAVALREAAPIRTRVDRVLGRHTDERAWRIGADGERAVAKRLGRLGDAWRVLHAVPVGERGSDIDHVVIGPGGVFTVNAKNHPDAKVWVRGDAVRVNGHPTFYVRNGRHEARRAAMLLSAQAGFDVEVHGLVAIMGMEGGFTVVEQPRDGAVTVLARKRIADHLDALPVVLGAPSVARIYAVARHLATWQPTTVERAPDF